jgi:mannan endo-1,4-beta-mannosidase
LAFNRHATYADSLRSDSFECARLGLGYMPWSWKGYSFEVSYLDMSSDWAGDSLTDWGRDVIEGLNGITATSQEASLFLLGT